MQTRSRREVFLSVRYWFFAFHISCLEVFYSLIYYLLYIIGRLRVLYTQVTSSIRPIYEWCTPQLWEMFILNYERYSHEIVKDSRNWGVWISYLDGKLCQIIGDIGKNSIGAPKEWENLSISGFWAGEAYGVGCVIFIFFTVKSSRSWAIAALRIRWTALVVHWNNSEKCVKVRKITVNKAQIKENLVRMRFFISSWWRFTVNLTPFLSWTTSNFHYFSQKRWIILVVRWRRSPI